MAVISIVVILLILGIAFYHFTEGFFTALISAISAVLAAVLAVSYVEPVVHLLLHGAGADNIHAIALVLTFVVAYILIRQIFDKLIPGNVRTPATIDKIGAAVMGLVAGTFDVGILVIAWQMLPFGPTVSLLGYNRYPLTGTRSVYVHGTEDQQTLDSFVYDQLTDPTLDPDHEAHLWYPADDIVMDTVYRLSNGGSLAGAEPLASVHPDWLSELFGMRLGMQTGSRRVALVLPGRESVSVAALYTFSTLPAHSGYSTASPKVLNTDSEINPSGYKSAYATGVKAGGPLVPLVVRIALRTTATDDFDKLFRFSPGAVRLVTRPETSDGHFGPGKDFYPIGMLQSGKTVVTNRVDDFLFVNLGAGDAGFDAVFMVDKSTLVGGKNNSIAVAPGTFIVVKRLAVLDLSGRPVETTIPADANYNVLRTDTLANELAPPKTH